MTTKKELPKQNFIDLRQDGSVQFWANTENEAKKMLLSIDNNLVLGGYFCLPKKQPKKECGSFNLSVKTTSDGNTLKNTYLFQNGDVTLRRSFKKVFYTANQFSKIVNQLGWKKEKENDS